MKEDYIHRSMPVILAEQAALRQIELIIDQSGKTSSDYNLPTLDQFLDYIPEKEEKTFRCLLMKQIELERY